MLALKFAAFKMNTVFEKEPTESMEKSIKRHLKAFPVLLVCSGICNNNAVNLASILKKGVVKEMDGGRVKRIPVHETAL